ncbi:unnamed protein product [Urochloa decumbens]|uniref:F-box protein AT5G49610-like beta-propeller domain-containing protein n=1 Tax=Urochloa decumbens TaxID=240449 RepID=A0ABC8ZPY2_9POAL
MSHDLARISWNAAVLCSSSSRVCNHLDCHRGPFLVVLMSTSADEVFVDIYSSEAGTWRPANAMQHPADDRVCLLHAEPSTLSGSALYFKVQMTMHTRIIQYSLGTRRIDYLTLPSDCSYRVQLTATEHGGLGFAKLEGSRLHLWSREDGPDGHSGWAQSSVIQLDKVLPASTCLIPMAGFVHGIAAFFMRTHDGFFSIDLKSGQVKKVYEGSRIIDVIPYMSFYTPAALDP